ncbi:MAG: sigma-70 family RNA polymerase sigma factor, partial [Myxococcota bacterium]
DDDDGGPMELADTDSATPEQSVAAQQVRSVVASYLETLTDADRKLLELRFIEGKSQRDAAEQLGLGRQQVRGRETKLRRGMLDYLRTQGELGLVEGATLMAGLSWLAALPLGAEPDLVVQCVHRWLRIVAPWGGGV